MAHLSLIYFLLMTVWCSPRPQLQNVVTLKSCLTCTTMHLAKLSIFKNHLYFSVQTLQRTPERRFKNIFNLSVVSHHEQYLGLPSMLGRSKKLFFNTLKARLWHKIKDWKAKLFSSGGKEILIKAVAQAIPTYAMSVFKLPFSFCHDLQKIITQFWWSQNSSSKSLHGLPWLKLCLSKQDGGLGFRELSPFNRALPAKQCW